jgi:predicted acylesterase/phospholipase RssA
MEFENMEENREQEQKSEEQKEEEQKSEEQKDKINIIQRQIKHLVISGGSIWGFSAFGILYEAISSGFLNIDDLESIYGTSIGAVVGFAVSLKIDHNTLKDYLINRPWEQVCKKSICSVLEVFDTKGLMCKTFFVEFFTPLLKSVDLDVTVTMQELYDYNKIDYHIYVTELNSFTLVDVSHKTHPNWLVIDAVWASCSIPLLITPMIIDNACYIDGGFFLNYPISKCIEKVENIDEIFGISLGNNDHNLTPSTTIHAESSIFDLLSVVLSRVINNNTFFSNDTKTKIPYHIHFFLKETTIDYCIHVLYNKNERHDLIYNGIQSFKDKCKEWFTSL